MAADLYTVHEEMLALARESNQQILELEKKMAELRDQLKSADLSLIEAKKEIYNKEKELSDLDVDGLMRKSLHEGILKDKEVEKRQHEREKQNLLLEIERLRDEKEQMELLKKMIH